MSAVEARDAALAILYTADLRETAPTDDIERARVRSMVEGVLGDVAAIDSTIESASRGWRVDRMPALDRNILRLAVWELENKATPTAVILSEAVRMAKTYSTERSGAFVNGVLATLADQVRSEAEPSDAGASVASRTDL
ncbi:MAG: transcription antitermination factor NusB [Acidimicrobiia bacterium]|nr:transcription antitermination factor NusB [Acidimicrobiia bacterium]NNF69410.1 transcription antitermination factor NusB [Acidimicrobiia bacterium]NNK91935.1 transcription antitermination factor NusB [Acidimicrobiia bacterium]